MIIIQNDDLSLCYFHKSLRVNNCVAKSYFLIGSYDSALHYSNDILVSQYFDAVTKSHVENCLSDTEKQLQPSRLSGFAEPSTRRHAICHSRVYGPALALVMASGAALPCGAAEDAPPQACASRDPRVFTLIEKHGEERSLPAEGVADAFMDLLAARRALRENHGAEALALYTGARLIGADY